MTAWLISLALLAQQLPSLPTALPPDAAPPPVKAAEAPAGPPRLVFEGKPLTVPGHCGDEQIQALQLGCSREEPCPLFLELAGLEAVGNSIFLTGNIHTELVTLDSILLASDDSGKTWTEPHARIRQGVIEPVQFIDFQNGWVAGQVMQTIPRDPFVLITNDGGKTWRRRPLFDDGRVGSVEYFAFTSKTQGTMVLDRSKAGDPNAKYELYETNTGGSSWQIREVSKTLMKPKRPLPGNGDWRLRADAASKAYRVERRTGAAWQTVASFLVRLPGCMPAEAPPVAEPPPPEPEAPVKPVGPPSLKKKP